MTPEERAAKEAELAKLMELKSLQEQRANLFGEGARPAPAQPQDTPSQIRQSGERIAGQMQDLNTAAQGIVQGDIASRPYRGVDSVVYQNPETGLPERRDYLRSAPLGPHPDDLPSQEYLFNKNLASNPLAQRAAVAANGLSLGFGPEIAGGMGALGKQMGVLPKDVDFREATEELIRQGRSQRPGESFLLETGSAIPTGVVGARGLSTVGVRGPATVGTIEGGVYGAGESNADTWQGRALGGGLGGAAGAVGGKLLGGGVSISNRLRAAASSRPTISSAARDEFGIPLTEGQITQDAGQIAFEESAYRGGRGDSAQGVMRPFREDQQRSVIEAGRRIGGDQFSTANEAGAALGEGLSRRAQQAQERISEAYDRARKMEASLNAEGVERMPGSVRDGLPDDVGFVLEGIAEGTTDPKLYPAFTSAIEAVDRVAKAGGELPFERIELARRVVNNSIDAAANPADRRAALNVKRAFDQYIDDAVDAALFNGDEAFLAAYKEARGLRAKFAEDFEANKLFDKIIARDASPEQVLDYILGANKIAPIERVRTVIPQLKRALGEDSPEWAALQEAAMKRVMRQTEKTFNPKVLRDNLDELLMGNNQTVAQELFSPEQYASLRRYRAVVDRLIPPDGAVNTSGTGYEIARQLRSEGGRIFSRFPILGKGVSAAMDKFLPDLNSIRARRAINPRSVLSDTTLLPPETPKGSSAMPAENALRLGMLGIDGASDPPIQNGIPKLLFGGTAKPEPTKFASTAGYRPRPRADGAPNTYEKVAEMAQNGMSRREIADEMMISEENVSVVLSKLRQQGMEFNMPRSASPVGRGEKTQMMIDMKKQGLTAQQIADRINAIFGKNVVHGGVDTSAGSVHAQLSRARKALKAAGKTPNFAHLLMVGGAAATLLPKPKASAEENANALATSENDDLAYAKSLKPSVGDGKPRRLPLSMVMQQNGIPYENWPDAAKGALSSKERAAYEAQARADEESRAPRFAPMVDPRQFGKPTAGMNQVSPPNGIILNPKPRTMEVENPLNQLLMESTLRRRAQLQDAAPVPDQITELLGSNRPIRWQEMATGLREAIASGQMTREEAAAELDKHLARQGLPYSLNIFRNKNALAAMQ